MFNNALLFIKKKIEFVYRIIVRRDTMNDSMSNMPPEKLPKETKNRIQRRLEEKGAMLPCPRCGNQQFMLADGLLAPSLQTSINDIVLGGRSIPSVVVICTQCGYISLHAVGVLGLMNDLKAEKNYE